MAAEGERRYFHPADYVVLTLSLAGSLGVGLYQALKSRKVRTTSEYHMGSRKFGLIPVCLSLVASFISSIALIGFPAEVYFYGFQTVISMFGVFFAALLSSWLFIPLLHPLGITSAQEYLEMRYESRSVRLVGAFFCMLVQLFYTGCVVYGQAAALEATTGLPSWASIVLVNVLGTIYTAFGGMKAVIWTDVFQVTVMFGSLVVVIILGLIQVGGPARMWQLNYDWGRIFVDLDPGLYTRLSLLNMTLAGTMGWAATYGVSQTSVQRFCAIPTLSQARKSMIGNAFGTWVFGVVCVLSGMVTFAFYAARDCDPYADGRMPNKNQILPYFVMEVLSYPGLPGLFVSGLFSGSLSTLSSNIAAMCAVTWEDLIKPVVGDNFTPSRQVTLNQLIAATIGLAGLGITYLVHSVGGSLMQIASSFFGLSAGSSLGIFVLGALFPWANWKGAIVGAFTSVAFNTWIFIGQVNLGSHTASLPTPTEGCRLNSTLNNTMSMSTMSYSLLTTTANATTQSIPTSGGSFLDVWLYPISYMWFGIIGLLVCLIVGLAVSFATGPTDPSTVDKKLLFTFMRGRFGKPEDRSEKEQKTLYPLLETNGKC